MRSIAIPVADRSECEFALDVALNLGGSLGADIVGYHMRPTQVDIQNVPLDMGSLWAAGGLSPAAWPVGEETAIARNAEEARRLFIAASEKQGYELSNRHGTLEKPKAVYLELRGTPDQLIPIYGPANDLLVVSRPEKKGSIKAWMVMMSALLDSTAPVLILPQKRKSMTFKRLAIAWNNGPTEALLLRSVMPLLQQADEILFITAGKSQRKGPSARQMINYLKAWGLKAKEKKVDDKETKAGKAIEKTAREFKADVLLSGAYTRGRMRELIFGGVTEYLVTDTNLPVIMLHK